MYEENGLIIDMTQEDFGTLCVCAIRYCHGRQTYMPDLVRNIVKSHIGMISDKDLRIMLMDCEFQKDLNLYGDEKIDKPGWIEWENFIKEQIEKRSQGENNI